MKHILLIALATIAFGTVGGTAGAAKPDRILATPSTACRILVTYGAGGYDSFRACMAKLNKAVAAFRFPADDGSGLISLSQRCTQFEQGVTDPETGEFFQLTYPFFFGEGGPDAGWPFPELTAQNHKQCEITLYTYHTLVGG